MARPPGRGFAGAAEARTPGPDQVTGGPARSAGAVRRPAGAGVGRRETMQGMHDLIIKGGTVVDGTGADARDRRRGRRRRPHHRVGPLEGGATRTIDADGLLVTPGWVDIHTHYDGQATWDELAPVAWHGVTTLVMGNCGVGFAPGPARPPRLAHRADGGRRGHPRHGAGRGHAVGVGDLPRVPRRAGAPALDRRRRHPDRPRRGAGLRHGRARGAKNEPATPEDIAADAGHRARRRCAAGALGFSTSRTIAHRAIDGEPVPGHLRGRGRAVRHRRRAGRARAPASSSWRRRRRRART